MLLLFVSLCGAYSPVLTAGPHRSSVIPLLTLSMRRGTSLYDSGARILTHRVSFGPVGRLSLPLMSSTLSSVLAALSMVSVLKRSAPRSRMFMPSLFLAFVLTLVYQYVFSARRSCACMITFHVLMWLDNLDNFHLSLKTTLRRERVADRSNT